MQTAAKALARYYKKVPVFSPKLIPLTGEVPKFKLNTTFKL